MEDKQTGIERASFMANIGTKTEMKGINHKYWSFYFYFRDRNSFNLR